MRCLEVLLRSKLEHFVLRQLRRYVLFLLFSIFLFGLLDTHEAFGQLSIKYKMQQLHGMNTTVKGRYGPSVKDLADSLVADELLLRQKAQKVIAAAELAYNAAKTAEVVGELVSQMLNTEDSIRHERAANLLAKLSENSVRYYSYV